MTGDRITPEEFARMQSLPVDHPERRHAMRTPELEARERLLAEFESAAEPAGVSPTADEIAEAGRELEARLATRIEAPAGRVTPLAARPRSRPAVSPRVALALAASLVAVSGVAWLVARPAQERVVRGGSDAAAFEMAVPRPTSGGVVLRWSQALGADQYRVEFFGPDMGEIGRVEGIAQTTLELRATALPTGLVAGREVLAVVTALRGDEVIAASRPRPVTLPR